MTYIDFLAQRDRPCAIVAHRGVWQDAPENSLLAIERAIAAGHDVVEIDIRQSADGEFVLQHDDTLDRMTGLSAAVEDISSHDLSKLVLLNRDGGSANAVTEQRLPLLRQVFALTQDRIFLHLDIKDRALIPGVLALAQSMGMAGQVDFWADIKSEADLDWAERTVMSHDVAFVARTRLEEANADRQLELVFALRPVVCELSFRELAQVTVQAARFRANDTALWVNTLDGVASPGFTDTAALADPDGVWGRLMDAGFSTIQTDAMDALRRFVARRQG
ncbi:MAG: glycerophosphodiester phosphodiesterase family protein [Cypionkella sp.]